MMPEFDENTLQRLTDVFNIVAAPATPSLRDALSPSTLARAMEDVYALATSADPQGNLGLLLGAFNEQQLTSIVDNVKAELMTPQTAADLAHFIKESLERTSGDQFVSQMQMMMQGRNPMEKMMMTMAIMQAMPMVESLRQAPEAEIAGQIVRMTAQLPTEQVVQTLSRLSIAGGQTNDNSPQKPQNPRKFKL